MLTESASRELSESLLTGSLEASDRFHIESYGADHPHRKVAEDFIAGGFLRSHNACVKTFLPRLLTLKDAFGSIHAVVGCRRADQERLFLERYLDSPIEAILSQRSGLRVERNQIVELGNLACRNAETARRFLAVLPRHLLDSGALWITFTATAVVRKLIGETGASPLDLALASSDRVADSTNEWGRYYATDPRVLAGYLPAVRSFPRLWKTIDED